MFRVTFLTLVIIPATSFITHQYHEVHQPSHIVPELSILKRMARPKSKWDDLTDDDENVTSETELPVVPLDMTYIESNIKRQMANYDKLLEIGGKDIINDVWVRAEGEKEWWLVGKIARVSGQFL